MGPDMPTTDLANAYPTPSHLEDLGARLVDEMTERWRGGDRASAEEFLSRYPELRDHPESAAQLIYEEFCLRRERGEAVRPHEFIERFPQWRNQLALLFDCARLFDGPVEAQHWPEPGERIGDFQAVAELGRGAVGRVYLATQAPLADRLVVLKVTPHDGREHLSLARLQHTHIVPLYSVHHDVERDLRVVCMPYFGGTTLERLLRLMGGRAASDRTGLDILDALDRNQSAADVAMPARGPAWQFLASVGYVPAVCLTGACLADALHYAHQRGIVHLDLKPSNVLLTHDGQPMLLDFHLAREPIAAGSTPPESLGGTVDYMSPEQLLAVDAVRAGRAIPRTVDCRSDVYSLGLVLYEALRGPLPQRSDRYSALREHNHRVSTGLSDVVAKCLAPNPQDRYRDAQALAEDLRRHVADLPLRGVSNRSFAEAWRKWRLRRPALLPIAALVLAVFAAACAVALVMRAHRTQRLAAVRTALDEGVRGISEQHFPAAIAALRRGLVAADALPGAGDLRVQLTDRLREAEHLRLRYELHAVTDQLRIAYAAEFIPTELRHTLDARCRSLWQNRASIVSHWGRDDGDEITDRVRADILDLAILWGDLLVRGAAEGGRQAAHRAAIQAIDDAMELGFSSSALRLERQRHAVALGSPETPGSLASLVGGLTPETAWEGGALGRFLLRAGDVNGAARAFDEALPHDPGSLWINYYSGVCAYRQGRFEDAVVSFAAGIGAAPELPDCYYNRALAFEALGRRDRALADYDLALSRQPRLAAARMNRAVLYLRDKRYAESAADLHQAMADGADRAAVHFNLALVHLGRGDRDAARSCLQASLDDDPNRKDARLLIDQLRFER
jgi:serine/threonine protein kinase